MMVWEAPVHVAIERDDSASEALQHFACNAPGTVPGVDDDPERPVEAELAHQAPLVCIEHRDGFDDGRCSAAGCGGGIADPSELRDLLAVERMEAPHYLE